MPKIKIAISIDPHVLARLDRFVTDEKLPSRSHAVEAAVAEQLDRRDRTRLARECAKLEPSMEKALAEEGIGEDLAEWPDY